MGGFQDVRTVRDCRDKSTVLRPFEDGAKGLVENRLHNYLRLCLVAIGKNDVVDSDAPRAVVLL